MTSRGTPRGRGGENGWPRERPGNGVGVVRLLSVNVGRPRPNPWKGISATGIDKRPVAARVAVAAPGPKGTGAVGLAGDRAYDVRQHGGADMAVCAYAREDLDGWEAELGLPLRDGMFGSAVGGQIGLRVARLGVGQGLLVPVRVARSREAEHRSLPGRGTLDDLEPV
jgi:hypothetical protein